MERETDTDELSKEEVSLIFLRRDIQQTRLEHASLILQFTVFVNKVCDDDLDLLCISVPKSREPSSPPLHHNLSLFRPTSILASQQTWLYIAEPSTTLIWTSEPLLLAYLIHLGSTFFKVNNRSG